MIWVLLVTASLLFLVWLDTQRIARKARRGPLHEADIRAASRPNGHVDIVGGGYRLR